MVPGSLQLSMDPQDPVRFAGLSVDLADFGYQSVIRRLPSTILKRTEEPDMHIQNNAMQGTQYSPTRIRATWDGTGSVEDASRALGFSRAKGYDLVRRGEFPCRVLRIGRGTRVVTASLLRVLEGGEPQYSGSSVGHSTPS